MDIYASDEEKAEAIKQWWRDNGRSVVAGVIFGAAAIFGGRYWLGHQQMQAEQASVIYQQAVVDIAQNEQDKAKTAAQQLMQDYPATAYAVFAALEMAQVATENNDYTAAKDYLSWVMEKAELSSHQELARLRLARLVFSEGDYEQAMTLVKASDLDAFQSLFAELEGDIQLAQGDNAAAHAAYQRAITSVALGEPRQTFLQMKLDDVAVAHEG